jgi:TolB-like protein
VFTKKYLSEWSVKYFYLSSRGVVCCLAVFFILFGAQTQAEESRAGESAIFLPFNIELAGDYGYLRHGLTSVLASRIATRTGIRVVHGTTAVNKITAFFKAGQQEKAFQALAKSGADYLIMGSLAQDDGEFVLTVNVVSRREGVAPKQFHRKAAEIDGALPMMDELAWDVSAEVFNIARPKTMVAPKKQAEGVSGMSGFQTEHPDRAYKEGMFAGIMPGFDSGELQLLVTKRSPKLPFGINDMDAGDLDGDGNDELVLAGVDQLYIYNFVDDHFNQVATIELDGYLRVHAISLADLNRNGNLEMYVSANKAGKPESMVIEWDGRQARFLKKNIPYYLHVAAPEGKPVLLGQVAGATGTSAVIGANIYRLESGTDGDFVRGEKFVLPEGLTLFDIAFADLDGSGEQKMIAITRANTLQVYDANGVLLWTDPGQYGGSSNYLGTIATAARSDHRVYVPPKIVVRDVTGDGIADIVVGKNRMKVIKYLTRYRYFEGSSIAALSWQQDRLVPVWETKKLPEYTVACQIVTPLDDVGKGKERFRLFFAQGQNNYSFGFWQTRSTSLFMYEIGLKKQQESDL